jgi:hypothetical protein
MFAFGFVLRSEFLVQAALFSGLLAAAACNSGVVGPGTERPAPPDSFLVTTNAGTQLTGPAARIDIRHVDATQPPAVEISFSAAGGSGGSWSALIAAPPGFLQTFNLTARVVDGQVVPGTATVQATIAGGDSTAVTAGVLSLQLRAGRLTGEARRIDNERMATFEGPFVVTCAVPAALFTQGAPAPSTEQLPPTLVVDENFESAPCAPYATLGG